MARPSDCRAFDSGHIYLHANMEATPGPMGEFVLCPDTLRGSPSFTIEGLCLPFSLLATRKAQLRLLHPTIYMGAMGIAKLSLGMGSGEQAHFSRAQDSSSSMLF